jgi:peptide-methionine (S)-S-oxide reductase
MISRFLAAAVIAVALVVGLASGAHAQKATEAVPDAGKGTATPAPPQEPASLGNSTTPADRPGLPAPRGETGKGTAETETSKGETEKATFGAGCFWHVESAFEWLPGVKSAVSGYSGGSVRNPSYEEVHEGITGHAEVVQVEYDPEVISYEQLLHVFWSHHDPTQLNRQGPDVGTQYRSVIFYHNEAQRKAALKSYRELTAARAFPGPIVTQLLPMKAFYRAEEYHQNYYGGKDGGRPAARGSRSRRTPKPALKTKAGLAAKPKAAKAAKAAKPLDTGSGSPVRSDPGRGGATEP